jgi:hypothetical protein
MQKDISLSRRSLLAAGAAGAAVAAASAAEAASFGNPDEPAEGAVNVVNPKALSDPGPQDPNLANNQPAFLNPPPTDVNGMPQYWASFNLAPKRIQNGGWGRQVTQDDFKISTTIAAVNMRLGPGGVRELHRLTNRCQETAVAQGFLPRSRKSFAVGFAAFVPHSALLSSNRMTAFVAAVRSTYLRMMLSTLPSVQPRISAITRSGNPAA